MGLINQEIFVCVDCESTGLDPEQDRLIEVAARRFTFDKVFQEYEALVDLSLIHISEPTRPY